MVKCTCGQIIETPSVGKNVYFCYTCYSVSYVKVKKSTQERTYRCNLCHDSGFLYAKRNILDEQGSVIEIYDYVFQCECRNKEKLKNALSGLKSKKNKDVDPITLKEVEATVKSIEFELYGNQLHINKVNPYDKLTGRSFQRFREMIPAMIKNIGETDRGVNSIICFQEVFNKNNKTQ